MADIKFFAVFTLSPAHNALASCCRQISRISGNLVLSNPGKDRDRSERVKLVRCRETRHQFFHDVAGVDRGSNPVQSQYLQLWNVVLVRISDRPKLREGIRRTLSAAR